jgi:3-hydroxyacyl-[acyl-carrier-protein] dehydratase
MSEIKKYGPYDNRQVQNFLPHRYPFLFVDKILSVEVPLDAGGKKIPVGTKVIGIKNCTINEPYFTGHFPGMPITPGVVVIETMAQICSYGVMPWATLDADMRVIGSFELRLAGVDNTRFRRPFLPGDQLKVTAEVKKQRGPIWAFHCVGEIDGQLVVESDLMASVVAEGLEK